ncbi:MAG TPA: MBL fold metallo-hydrolase [Flavipsychrobacter sp.]|nr:MBL fold metallo-hydrolase [Flavipsychrobacter sp.]
MKITFLGTGTSQGVPLIGCDCAVCTSPDPHDNRLRTSVWIETPEASIVIDTGPDFRYQMLRANVRKLDAIIFTHGHKDHVAGLDDVRAYNYFQQKPMEIYANEHTQEIIHREFEYVFNNKFYPGIPQLSINTINSEPVNINGLEIIPIKVMHYKLEVLAFRIGDFTYVTDANQINPEEINKIKGSKILVLNALRHEQHISHFTLAEAIDMATVIGAEQTYFTHISHQMGLHLEINSHLPPGINLAYDGLCIKL